jgi:hypothetical protein
MFMSFIAAAGDLGVIPRFDPIKEMGAALKADEKRLFRALVKHDPACINKRMVNGEHLLPLAVSLGKKWAVDILIEAKADVNVPESSLWPEKTSLHIAATHSDTGILTALLQAHADVEGHTSCRHFPIHTPLNKAVRNDRRAAVKILLEYGAESSRVFDQFRREYHSPLTGEKPNEELRTKFASLLTSLCEHRERRVSKAASFVFAWEQQVGELAKLPLDMIKVIGKKCLVNPADIPPIEVKPGDVARWKPSPAGAGAGAAAGK